MSSIPAIVLKAKDDGALSVVPMRDLLQESQNGLSKRSGDSGDAVPVLRLANVTDGAVDESALREIRLTDKEVAKYALESGDLLCIRVNGSRNLVGRVVPLTSSRRWAYCDHFIRLRPRHDLVDHRYLAHYLNTRDARRYIELNMVSSAGQNTVSQGTMLDLLVPLPSLDIQRATLAEVEKQFSRLDEAVADLKRVKANLKRQKAAIYQTAADGSLDGRTHESELPVDWTWSTCGAVIERIEAGASFKCLERPPEAGEVGVVKVSAVTWGTFNEIESKTCTDAARVNERVMVRTGDFLFSRANTIDLIGACVIVGSITRKLMLSDKILRFRLAAVVDPSWLLVCLRSRFGRTEIERLATGNQESMRNIGQDRIRQIRLPLPPIAEQHRIVAEVDRRLSIVREVEAEVDANLKRAQALRQAVLASVFT